MNKRGLKLTRRDRWSEAHREAHRGRPRRSHLVAHLGDEEAIEVVRLELAVAIANAPPVAEWNDELLVHFRSWFSVFLTAGIPRRKGSVYRTGFAGAHSPSAYTREAFEELKTWTESVLERFISDGRVVIGLTAADLGNDGAFVFELVRDADGNGSVGAMRGAPIAVYMVAVGFLLASAAGHRLRRCPDAKCGRYFLRVGRMTACSRRCTMRIYMRTYNR